MAKEKLKKICEGIWKDSQGRWVLKAFVRPNKSKQCRMEGSTPRSDAMKRLEEMKAELMESSLPTTSSLKIRTIKDALEFLKISPKRKGGERKYLQIDSRVEQIKKELGHIMVHDSYGALMGLVNKLKRRGKHKPGTINRVISITKAAIRNAYDTKVGRNYAPLIAHNYLAGFPTEPEDSIRYMILSPSQRAKLWEVLDPRLKPMYYFALRFPCRINELVNIRREDVNPFSETFTVKPKNGITRQIIIPKEFMPYVWNFWNSPADFLFNRGEAEEYLPLGYFSEKKQKWLFSLTKSWRESLTSAGIKGYTFHKTRQEAVLNLHQEKHSEQNVMHLGGWLDVKAFNRYFDRNRAIMISNGRYDMELGWYVEYAKEWGFLPSDPAKVEQMMVNQ